MRIESHPVLHFGDVIPTPGKCRETEEHGTDSAPIRILMDSDSPPASPADRSDLARVEELLERCWRELDTTDLNVKLTDIVRLLEFKSRLRPAADAEAVFWSLIHQLRREELADPPHESR
ncbi:MAG: hypothetical protein AB1752_09055 [Candidatus Zixiibacteriota bacterium]